MMTALEVTLSLNGHGGDRRRTIAERVEDFSELIEFGDLRLDVDGSVHTTDEGKTLLLVLPATTD